MPSVLVWIAAVGLVIVESVLLDVFSVSSMAIQTPVAVTILLGLDKDLVSGGLILVALFFPVEWLVGGVYGVYSVGLAVVFLATSALRENLQRNWGVARMLVASGAAVLHPTAMLVALAFIGEATGAVGAVIGVQMWISIPLVAVATVLLGRGFARLEQMRDSRTGGENKLQL